MLGLSGNVSCCSYIHRAVYINESEGTVGNSCLIIIEFSYLQRGFGILTFLINDPVPQSEIQFRFSFGHEKWSNFSEAGKRKISWGVRYAAKKQKPKTAPLYFSWVISPTGQTHSFDISNIKAIMPLLCLTMTDWPRVVPGIRKSDSEFTIPSWVCDKSLAQEQLL